MFRNVVSYQTAICRSELKLISIVETKNYRRSSRRTLEEGLEEETPEVDEEERREAKLTLQKYYLLNAVSRASFSRRRTWKTSIFTRSGTLAVENIALFYFSYQNRCVTHFAFLLFSSFPFLSTIVLFNSGRYHTLSQRQKKKKGVREIEHEKGKAELVQKRAAKSGHHSCFWHENSTTKLTKFFILHCTANTLG